MSKDVKILAKRYPYVIHARIDPLVATKAMQICQEEKLPCHSISACIEAIIEYADKLRIIEKLAKTLLELK